MTDEASTTTWETVVEQYRERAKRDDARIDELTQRANHWHDVADMMKRQRDMAEEERDSWKIRAMKAEQERQALRDECDALRKDAARYRWLRDYKVREVAVCDIDVVYYLDGLDAYIDAALAVQPTTGEGDE